MMKSMVLKRWSPAVAGKTLGPHKSATRFVLKLQLKRLSAELTAARSKARRVELELSTVTCDASGLVMQLQHLQQLLITIRGEVERKQQEATMSWGLLQQYHAAAQQLLAALEAVNNNAVLQHSEELTAAAQKLLVANMQLDTNRYLRDFCQEAISLTEPLPRAVTLMASLEHTTTTSTTTHFSQHALGPLRPIRSPSTNTPSVPSSNPSTPLLPPSTRSLSPSTLPPRPLPEPSHRPQTPSTPLHHVTTTTTTTACTQLTLTCTPAQAHFGAAQAAWQSYFSAINVALEDPDQHTLSMVPALLCDLCTSLALNMYRANLAYWAAVLALPHAVLQGVLSLPGIVRSSRSPFAATALVPRHSRGSPVPAPAPGTVLMRSPGPPGVPGAGVGSGVVGVAVAYLNYALTMASAGLEILNTLTSAWCCVIHSLHTYVEESYTAPGRPSPSSFAVQAVPVWCSWVPRLVRGAVVAKVSIVLAAAWAGFGLWHLAVSMCCVLLGSCNMLGSFFAAAVQQCTAGAEHLPQLTAADLAQSLYQSSAHCLALSSLTCMYGCTYLYWSYIALQGVWSQMLEPARVAVDVAWWAVAVLLGLTGRLLVGRVRS